MKLVAIFIYSQVLLTSLYFELQLFHAYNSAQELFFKKKKKKSHDLMENSLKRIGIPGDIFGYTT